MSVRWIDDLVAADGKASGFGEPFPDAVGRIGVTLTAPGFSCCIAFDPRDGAFTQQRRIVLTDLPAGNMTVHVAGFVGSVPGPSQPCSVKNPSNIGGPCDPQACDLPSYDAPSVDVDLEPGRENNAGMLFETVSVPALFDAVSLCDASSDRNPIRIAVTVAVPNTLCTCGDAVSFCDDTPADVLLEATQLDTDPRPHPCDDLEPSPNAESIFVNSVCCIDRPDCTPRGDGSPCCTANGERGLAGVRFDDVVAGLQAGCVRFRITTQDFPSGRRQLDYKLLVTAAGPSPTPTVSSTPLPSVTDTATPTRTDTATPTPTVSPTDTVSPTPTDTASVQIP